MSSPASSAEPCPVARGLEPAVFTGPPIFLSGCSRGGTTIVTRILGAHPDVRNIGRSQFCEGQYIWRQRFPDWSRHRWALPPWRWTLRRTARDATPGHTRFFRSAFTAAMPSPGRLLEKTPANAVRLPLIDALFPDCCFVHVIRDGRHTSASLVARKVWWPYAPHQWVAAHRTALADLGALPQHRVTLLRYEEMVEDPELVLRSVCERTGLTWNAAGRDAVMQAARSQLRDVEDRWRRLPGYQRRYVLRVIGDLQSELGYPVTE